MIFAVRDAGTPTFFIYIPTLLFFMVIVFGARAQNYDESKVGAYTLPETLKTSNGRKVRNTTDWEKERRPQILRLFEDNIYGQMPKNMDSLRFSVTEGDRASMDGKANLKQVHIEVFKNDKAVRINVVLFIPVEARKPVPVFLLINNRPQSNTDPTRETKSDFWPAEMLIDSGYAIAAFHVSDLAPDNKDTFSAGVLQLYPDQLTADNGMRAIGAWAWGASRVMDYFQSDPEIDAKKVTVVGHSRGGKASLWAAAQDQRFAACITNCSGNSGAALSRRKFGERVARINTSFPHWFNNNYKKFNDNEDALPVDQHMLIAMVAPRPVYATNASKDLWADPKGTYLALKNAEPVWALYDIKSALSSAQPGINEPIIHSPLAYHNREGEHNLTAYDWSKFISFARFHFGR
jgi:hypothetical protein